MSTAAEKDITGSGCTEFGQDSTSDGVLERAENALGKGEMNGKRVENKRKKGKVEGMTNSELSDVDNTVLPILKAAKRKYVKRDIEFWENKKKKKGK